jgi:hypothetical protein
MTASLASRSSILAKKPCLVFKSISEVEPELCPIRLLRAAATAHPDLAEEIGAEIDYFETNNERMRYPEFREQGLFVGSGVIEAGCNAECIVTPSCAAEQPPILILRWTIC